jgi:hypothetical protein
MIRMHHPILIAATISGALTGAIGCGGGTKDAASEAADTVALEVDNCSLVTDAEASSLAGRELKHDADTPLGCPYVRPGESMSLLTVRTFAGRGAAKDHFGTHSSDTTVHEIQGVGDSAAALARDEHVNFLIVQKGNRYVRFVTTFVDDLDLGSPKLKQAQELALTALGRIK